MRNKVIIYKTNNIWNWEYWDKYTIPIYGRCFNSKLETVNDFKRYAKEMNIINYEREDIEYE